MVKPTAHTWLEHPKALGRPVSPEEFHSAVDGARDVGVYTPEQADHLKTASAGVDNLKGAMEPLIAHIRASERAAVGLPPDDAGPTTADAGPIRYPDQWHAAKARVLAHAMEKMAEARAAGAPDLATTIQNIRDEKTEAGKHALRQAYLNTHPEHADLGERLMSGTLMKGR